MQYNKITPHPPFLIYKQGSHISTAFLSRFHSYGLFFIHKVEKVVNFYNWEEILKKLD